jgi:hypothetical protein
MTAYAAHLRVYEPLAAFEDGPERARWTAYVAAGDAPSRERGPELEREAALRALVGVPPTVVPELPEHAYVTEVDGVTLVCPWRTRVRAWEALAEFRADLSDPVADAFVPRAVADAASDALDDWRTDNPALRTAILSSPWQVPVRWFVLVDPEEREVRPGTAGQGSAGPGTGAPPRHRTGRSLVYRTAMSRARRRTARALSVMRRVLGDDGAVAGVEDLGRWLEEFHPRSLVELDYGGLVHLLDDAELRQDESARDVAEAMSGLADGEPARAAGAYGRVTARMKALQGVESAN